MAILLRTLPEVTVATPGTRVALYTSNLMVYCVSVQSLPSNTGTHYIGDSTVSSSNGVTFAAGDVAEIDGPPGIRGGQEQFDLSTIYVDATVGGTKFRITAWTR